MLTGRSGWFLFIVFLTLIVGAFVIPYYSVAPALIGITLLVWFALEWVLFQTRSLATVSQLRVSRCIFQGGREVPMVWAGLAFEVRVTVENPGTVAVPFAVLEDRTAVATERIDGTTKLFTELRPGESVKIVYKLKVPAPGVLRFEGVQVRVADLQGFFYRRLFLRDAAEYLVLPPLTDDEGRQRATKRFNTLPAPGIHRLRRPGSGSELLDLRDYRPGDPPKMIAWKPSARRDRLIIKEYENDVPVRCVLFLDTSEGVRLGPPGNTLLTRLAGVAAVVAQASAANRDLVGLTTLDENEAKAIAPARTKIHMINLLRRLAEVSALQPGVTGVPTEQLTRRAYPLAHELYPEVMTKKINSMTLGRLWIPILDRKWGWVVFGAIFIGVMLFALGSWAFSLRMLAPQELAYEPGFGTRVWRWILNEARRWFVQSIDDAASLTPKRWPFLVKLAWMNVMFVLTYFPPATLGVIIWFFHSIRGLFGERKRELIRRKQLSALFSLQDGTGVNGVERYVHDDEAYAARVAKFLQQHLLRCPVPLYDEAGSFRFRCAGKAPVLADAMIRAVGRARDNELYVVLADLAELGTDLAPVVKACRVARSRHHHVLVIVPWPADVPSPDNPEGATPKVSADDDPIGRRPGEKRKRKPRSLSEEVSAKNRERDLMKVVRQSLTKQYHESFRILRRQLGQVGATVMRANDGDPVQLVLDRLDRLRGMRSRR
ncbi:MAG TPA: DUF58 domain-containing protein [Gemmata sp.]|nr:DUF58 domain-containing protein [Gemmata sp.]